MTRPRIALVVPSLAEGGGVPAVARFIKDAVQRSGDFELKLVSLATSARDMTSLRLTAPGSWLRGEGTRQGEWEGLSFFHVGAEGVELEFQRFQARRELSRLLSDCDLVQVVAGSPAWAISAAGLGKPVALQVATRAKVERRRRERLERGPVAWWRWVMTQITDRFDDRGLQLADAVLVENPWMFRYSLETTAGFGTWVRYAPPGIDTALFHAGSRRLFDEGTDDYILSVGRFDDPRKNVSLLLDAFVALRRQYRGAVRLQLAGLGGPGPDFWERVERLGLKDHVAIHLRPSREELAAYYRDAACFALSSEEEGFGIVVVEAMASGIPVVATRCGGPDGIVADGIDGFLVPNGDAAAIAGRLRHLLEDRALNRRIGLAARATAERRFSERVTGDVFLDTYRQLLAGGTAGDA